LQRRKNCGNLIKKIGGKTAHSKRRADSVGFFLGTGKEKKERSDKKETG